MPVAQGLHVLVPGLMGLKRRQLTRQRCRCYMAARDANHSAFTRMVRNFTPKHRPYHSRRLPTANAVDAPGTLPDGRPALLHWGESLVAALAPATAAEPTALRWPGALYAGHCHSRHPGSTPFAHRSSPGRHRPEFPHPARPREAPGGHYRCHTACRAHPDCCAGPGAFRGP